MQARYRRQAAMLVLAALGCWTGMPAFAATTPVTAPIEGIWLTQAKSEITVSPCASDFCGNITRIVVPDDIYKANKKIIDSIGATNFTDEMNKDPTLRSRPILGLQILTLHPSDKPQIFNGEIYNPQDGNTYSGYVEVLGPDRIRLNGCILYNIICKGEDWTRVTPPPAPAAATPGAADSGAAGSAPAAPVPAPAVDSNSFQ